MPVFKIFPPQRPARTYSSGETFILSTFATRRDPFFADAGIITGDMSLKNVSRMDQLRPEDIIKEVKF